MSDANKQFSDADNKDVDIVQTVSVYFSHFLSSIPKFIQFKIKAKLYFKNFPSTTMCSSHFAVKMIHRLHLPPLLQRDFPRMRLIGQLLAKMLSLPNSHLLRWPSNLTRPNNQSWSLRTEDNSCDESLFARSCLTELIKNPTQQLIK